ncbi:MAG TPA: FGGY family carbohydrate kinase [Jatrophihabitans sp.]|jgi:sugar (pentulose or hexulose) kinase|uniref:FGGY-family carbohydrate kinase n=1 Tax=Jatrophihabitans sp. TaxID=1932789 RepID=UPI002F12C3DF
MGYLVGLDVGTTSSKAVVLDSSGAELSQGRAATSWHASAAGVQTDAAEVLASARLAVAQALRTAPRGPVIGVGVASMGESGVLLDRGGDPVAPVIAWHDNRDAEQARRLGERFGAEDFARRTGLPLRCQWSLTKHRWLIDHHAPSRDAVRRLGIAEWVVRQLGGEEVSEASLASRTGWLELETRAWWPEALEWSGMRPSLLPPLVTAGAAVGRVPSTVGLDGLTGAVLTVAGHDHQAAAIGARAAGAGDVLDSCGTAEALIRTVLPGLGTNAVLALTEAGITVGWHVLPGHWCLLGGTQGGLVLQRVLGALGKTGSDLASLDLQALAADPAGVQITGDDPVGISGITEGTGPAQVWRAALDEVTRRAGVLDAAMTAVSGRGEKFIVTGGWARSQALLEIKRRAFGRLTHTDVREAGARGAAILAGVAAGVYRDVNHAQALTHASGA